MGRALSLLYARRTTRALRRFRTRRPPRGEPCHAQLFDAARPDASVNPVRRAAMNPNGISLWIATGVPFRRETLFVPWPAVTDACIERENVQDPGWLGLGGGVEVWIDWGGAEIIRELGVALPSSEAE